jgi:DNA replication protein DnaC
MEPINFVRCAALNNIPAKKLQDKLTSVQEGSETQDIKNLKLIAYNRYYEANIPMLYWDLKMEKDFVGDPRLKIKYDEYVSDIKNSYITGKSLCLAGQHGVGKTFFSTCTLKKVSQKGYSALYVEMSNIISVLIQGNNEDKFSAKRELMMVDFLVIDELDPRFFATDNAADLYARSLEGIFRARSSNKLPTLICTNSPNMVESFTGALKASLDSLMKGYMEFFPVLGTDHRKVAK